MGKIFISHSSANNAEALAMHDWLGEHGWGDVFLDLDPRRGLVAGDRWQAALKAAAEQCELILVLISPDWAKSKWCLAEFLLAKQMNKQILGVVVEPTPLAELPVELTAEWQLVDLTPADPGWSTTISPPRIEPETTVHFSGTGIARLLAGLEKAGLDATTFNWPPPHDPGRAPYRGLLPLDADDAGIFFGRDGAIVLTMDVMRGLQAGAAPRVLTILGASGAGKSSFLRAGLLPRLERDSRHFRVLPLLRPGRAALSGEHGIAAMLEAALRARGISMNRADIREAVGQGAAAIRPLLRRLVEGIDSGDAAESSVPTLVLAVDQAEELLSADNAEGGTVLTLIAALATAGDPAILVIFTVRSDSFDQLQSRPELAATQPHHLVDLPPVPAGAYGDIIRGPARRVSAAGRKLTIEETLVDALLTDIAQGGGKDALPLLAFTLERLYRDYGADGDLRLGEYERLGRIRGAIEAAVEQALGKADANPAIPRDRAARLALLRRGLIPWLAGVDPATGTPRRRVARLAEVPAEARPLIELMVEERLLATDIDKATGERTIEPAHEALLRQWGALDSWLAEDAADLSIVEALRRAATEWEANARGAEYLVHKGVRLATAEQVTAGEKFAGYLTSVDRDYLAAARQAENSVLARARAARLTRNIAAAVLAVVLVGGGTAGWFIWSAGQAARQRATANLDMARAEAALRAGKPEQAVAAAQAAYDLMPSTVTRTALFGAGLAVSPYELAVFPVAARVIDVALPDPDHVAALTARGLVTIDAGMHQAMPPALPQGAAPSVALAADGARVVHADGSITGPGNRTIAAAPADGFAGRAGTVSASADGRLVAMVGLTGDVLVRDCRTSPCADRHVERTDATAVAVAPNGSAVAIAGAGLELYGDPAAAPRTIPGIAATAIAWSPDARRLLVADAAGRYVVDAAAPEKPAAAAPLEGARPNVAAWSPDGSRIAAACGNDICLFAPDMTLAARFTGHRDAVAALRWSPDGTTLASASADGTVRVWSTEPDPGFAVERQSGLGALTALAVDRTRGTIAVGDRDGGIATWTGNGASPQRMAAPRQIGAPVTSLAFLADGRLAAVYENRAVGVWTPGRPAPDRLVTLDNLAFSRVAALSGDIRAAVPLSDRSILVLSGDDLHEARVPADTVPLDQWGLAAAPAADTAFVSYSDGSIRRRALGTGGAGETVYDAHQPLCGVTPTTDNNGAKSLDVSADGKWLVATRTDAAIIAHNLADTSKPICLSPPDADSRTVAFSPDGTRLAVLSATDRLSLFDLAHPDAPLILAAPATPHPSTEKSRITSWLAWVDDRTLAIATTLGTLELVSLDETQWRARVDSLDVRS